MKILLLGEYSNVHWNLALGLRALGHEVCVASGGDGWKNYKRDINLSRKSLGTFDSIKYYIDILKCLPRFRGYDIVQIINPVFLNLKAEKILPFYRYLRKHNGRIYMGAFGMDYYWVKTCLDCRTFRYSDFNMGNSVRQNAMNDIWIQDWLNGPKGILNQQIAHDCDGIVTGLYEYHCCYQPVFQEKTRFIPFPIHTESVTPLVKKPLEQVRFFIGIQKERNEYKGTDIMLAALERAKHDYPGKIVVTKVESVPFPTYKKLLNGSDVILDQLYAYTPAMNALTAMAQGLVVIGGGEPEAYDLLGDNELRPVVNVLPNEQSVYDAVVDLTTHPEKVTELSRKSVLYVQKYHSCQTVAQQYLDFWNSGL